jgi:hypothetical protein
MREEYDFLTRNREQFIINYVIKRSYHYTRLHVATSYDRACLDLDTLYIRKRELENDEEYLALAKIVWGEDYDLKNDDLWIHIVWRMNYKINVALNPLYIPPRRKRGRFGIENNLHEFWEYAKDNRNSITVETMLEYINKEPR